MQMDAVLRAHHVKGLQAYFDASDCKVFEFLDIEM